MIHFSLIKKYKNVVILCDFFVEFSSESKQEGN